jgi:hypothetical protein
MKQFLVYNKESAYFIDATSMDEAKQKAISICDNSHEIIIREVKEVKFFLKNLKSELALCTK